MSEVIANDMLSPAIRGDFLNTYEREVAAMADTRLGMVMDLSVGTTSRTSKFAYYNAAPHPVYWPRGQNIPEDSFDSVQFELDVFEWAVRVPWNKFDRQDDQTDGLLQRARGGGKNAARMSTRFFFDILSGSASTLPAIPQAPDGAALFSGTHGDGSNRFEAVGGNIVAGSGVANVTSILTDYYAVKQRFRAFLDRKAGQPLLIDDEIDSGVVIIHSSANEKIFEEAFRQQRQGIVLPTNAGTTPSNVVIDSSHDVTLWSTSRLADDDWFVFLKNGPLLPTFLLTRQEVREFTAMEGDQNSDTVRDTGKEYMQFELRSNAGIALPYGVCKVNN